MVGTFTTNLNLREFPFDSQELKVDLSSFQYGPEDVLFMDEGSDLREGLKITGWNIMGNEAHTSGESGNETSHYTHVITVDRDETYMLLQLMPFLFIVIMAWGVFWLDPKDYGAQIGMATGAVFALIALLISMRQVLPKVTYLTRADELVVGCTILVFISLGEVVFVSRLVQDGKGDKARRVDFHARWMYILFFVGILG